MSVNIFLKRRQIMKTRKILALVLSIVMLFSLCATGFAAYTAAEIEAMGNEIDGVYYTDNEIANGDLSHFIATQSYVLLENNGVLPLEEVGSVALYGNGVKATIKGGTGSGAVNNRYNDNVYSAFVADGWEIANPSFCDRQSTSLRAESALAEAYIAEGAANTDLAIYVISRQAGEFSDRTETDGTKSFTLTANEKANIEALAAAFDRFVVVYNTCMMDTDTVRETEGVDAVFFMSNGGFRGSEALVDVLTGDVTPSGKLTDTWALDLGGEYGYVSTPGFANNDGNTATEYYPEGIFNGYRYFDTWGIPVAYEFGFGMSYTEFDIDVVDVAIDGTAVVVDVDVTNVGGEYSGKEVVQVYFSAPDGRLEKPYQELAAYGKTDELEPGEKQTLTLKFATEDMSSYDEELAAYIMEDGQYIIRVGNSSRNTHVAATATLESELGYVITEQLSNQLHLEENAVLEEISKEGTTPITYEGEAAEIAAAPKFVIEKLPYANNASENDAETITTYLFAEDAEGYEARESITLRTKAIAGNLDNRVNNKGYMETTYAEVVEIVPALPQGITAENAKLTDVYEGKITMDQFLACLSADECARIAVGGAGTMEEPDVPEGDETYVGAQASAVKGGAGQTTQAYYATRHIPAMPNADGPAGIRISKSYKQNGETLYQYCTAFPAGSCYAMSWDVDLIYSEGVAIGSEMQEYGVTTWLAPGLNIHRNPLCGRNFEYYSEDPFVTGICAAYVTMGVQSNPGIGVTLKHFWGNSQETNRNAENNVISERAAREIYLKGFEIGVKLAQPMCIMNCYNGNNGWPGSDDWDTNEDITRGEWGFKGAIMTDWGGGQSTPLISMHAGCDMIMSGGDSRLAQVRAAVGAKDPKFGEDGNVFVTVVEGTDRWGRPTITRTAEWGTFVAMAGGPVEYKAPVAGYEALAEEVLAAIEAGQAKFCHTADGDFVTWYGNHINAIAYGDVQKAARRVLNNALVSQDMVKLYADLFDTEIQAPSISEARDALLTEGWWMVQKSDIVNVGLVADRVVADCADGEALVDIIYTGDADLSTVRFYIDSALPIADVYSDYDIEYNPAEGYVVIWGVDGIDDVVATLVYDISANPWLANGEYPIAL
ncbi:MAG: hypothetical protein E7456_03360, partial [Ruminococcaceae bacterium]|nr:hypothetical protein [Oscillospiraceae bacterium]